MENIQNALRMAADGRMIKMKHALSIGAKADEMLMRSVALLKTARKQMGEIDGEEVAKLLAEIQGHRFNAAAFSYDREPDGQ